MINDLNSPSSASAGCVADPEPVAGCDGAPGETQGRADDLPTVGDARAGCAAPAASDVAPQRPRPPTTRRELEAALRGLGFSRREAEGISRSGFAALEGATLPDESFTELRAALERRAAALKG